MTEGPSVSDVLDLYRILSFTNAAFVCWKLVTAYPHFVVDQI